LRISKNIDKVLHACNTPDGVARFGRNRVLREPELKDESTHEIQTTTYCMDAACLSRRFASAGSRVFALSAHAVRVHGRADDAGFDL
jgi:hypothetical protein